MNISLHSDFFKKKTNTFNLPTSLFVSFNLTPDHFHFLPLSIYLYFALFPLLHTHTHVHTQEEKKTNDNKHKKVKIFHIYSIIKPSIIIKIHLLLPFFNWQEIKVSNWYTDTHTHTHRETSTTFFIELAKVATLMWR